MYFLIGEENMNTNQLMTGLHEECGIFAVYGHANASALCYYGLHSLQHRGQEAAGILVRNNKKFTLRKQEGLISEIFDAKKLESLVGDVALGHVRYATAGGANLANVQPMLFETLDGCLGIAQNGNLVNWKSLRHELEDSGSIFQSTSDTEIIAHLIKKSKGRMIERINYALNHIDGGFALVLVHEEALYAARDPHGLRPLSLGQLPNGAYIVSSETCALEIVGATFIRDILPGEIIRIKENEIKSMFFTDKIGKKSICAMEYIYFARPDSNIDGLNVHTARKNSGKQLYLESKTEADLVIGVPDSSISAAIGYAEASGIPYEMGLIKNKYVGRTFIQPTQELREQGVRMKLSAVSAIVKGKRVIMIDDSIVRGTTSKRIVRLLKEAGAIEVHVKIASAPFKYPCFYGVDTSTFSELISNRMNIAELCNYIEADSLAFISVEGVYQAFFGSKEKKNLCMACFTGEYPTKLYGSLELANKDR